MHRLYTNDDLTVFWNSDRCRHARKCVAGCPGVFEFGRRPWIILDNAENADIWKTIEKCPSGALDICYNHGVRIEVDDAGSRSVAYADGREIGECDYEDDGIAFRINLTEVDPSYAGKGIAKRLVYCVLEAAERRKRDVIAICPYAVEVMK